MEAKRSLSDSLQRSFPHAPTEDQASFIVRFDSFLRSAKSAFLLKGYAGTGKTRLMRSLTDVLPDHSIPVVLLAPTGRAAKILEDSAGRPASTIHRHIYRPMPSPDGSPTFVLKPNKQKNALFIVDEASMVGDGQQDLRGRSLLEDLIRFVFESQRGCRLLFIGDVAQLPPIGTRLSKALDAQFLRDLCGLEVEEVLMTQVVRQKDSSGILHNATALRRQMQEEGEVKLQHYSDFELLEDHYAVEEAVQESFQSDRLGEALYIVRSNKRANAVNQAIRAKVLYREEELSAGDHLMVVRNNYFWLGQEQGGFIANGEQMEVQRILRYEDKYGLRFAQLRLLMQISGKAHELEAWVHLDSLSIETPSFPSVRIQQLYRDVQAEHGHLSGAKKRKAVLTDPYLQALQVKFAYAVTCHKSQGGQWKRVLIEKPWLPEGRWMLEDKRWLYTAVTRAEQKVQLMGFNEEKEK